MESFSEDSPRVDSETSAQHHGGREPEKEESGQELTPPSDVVESPVHALTLRRARKIVLALSGGRVLLSYPEQENAIDGEPRGPSPHNRESGRMCRRNSPGLASGDQGLVSRTTPLLPIDHKES